MGVLGSQCRVSRWPAARRRVVYPAHGCRCRESDGAISLASSPLVFLVFFLVKIAIDDIAARRVQSRHRLHPSSSLPDQTLYMLVGLG